MFANIAKMEQHEQRLAKLNMRVKTIGTMPGNCKNCCNKTFDTGNVIRGEVNLVFDKEIHNKLEELTPIVHDLKLKNVVQKTESAKKIVQKVTCYENYIKN